MTGDTCDEQMLAEEADVAWLEGVFSQIPRTVYYGRYAQMVNDEAAGSGRKKKSTQKRKNVVRVDLSGELTPLQKRLRDVISARRKERKADDPEMQARRLARKRKREEAKAKGAKKKAMERKQNRSASHADNKSKKASSGQDGVQRDDEDPGQVAQRDVELSRVEGFANESTENDGTRHPKKRMTKKTRLVELEKQLEGVIQEREQAKAVTSGGNEEEKSAGDAMKQREVDKALQRAKGVAVRDDVSKLRKTIRKEKRKSEKSREEWGKRVQALEEEKLARAKKREENLKARKENKGKSKPSKARAGKRKPGKKR